MFKGYKEYKGVLVKKKRTICCRYVFELNDRTKIISVKVEKALFDNYQLRSEITIGCKGGKIINIKSGIVV